MNGTEELIAYVCTAFITFAILYLLNSWACGPITRKDCLRALQETRKDLERDKSDLVRDMTEEDWARHRKRFLAIWGFDE